MQHPSPYVSVVIPTYNREHLIQAAIESVLKQTFLDYELIIVDDASTDATVEFISNTYSHIPQIQLLPLAKNRGPGGARNEGILAAKGELIAFFDSDDWWEPTFLEIMVSQLKAHPEAVLAFCNVVETDPELNPFCCNFKPWRGYPNLSHRILLTEDIIFTMSVVVVRRSTLLDVGLISEVLTICEDKDLYLRLLKIGKFIHVSETLVKKVAHEGNLVKKQVELIDFDQQVIDLFFQDPENSMYRMYEAEAKSYALLRRAKAARWFHHNFWLFISLFLRALYTSPRYILIQFFQSLHNRFVRADA